MTLGTTHPTFLSAGSYQSTHQTNCKEFLQGEEHQPLCSLLTTAPPPPTLGACIYHLISYMGQEIPPKLRQKRRSLWRRSTRWVERETPGVSPLPAHCHCQAQNIRSAVPCIEVDVPTVLQKCYPQHEVIQVRITSFVQQFVSWWIKHLKYVLFNEICKYT